MPLIQTLTLTYTSHRRGQGITLKNITANIKTNMTIITYRIHISSNENIVARINNTFNIAKATTVLVYLTLASKQ